MGLNLLGGAEVTFVKGRPILSLSVMSETSEIVEAGAGGGGYKTRSKRRQIQTRMLRETNLALRKRRNSLFD